MNLLSPTVTFLRYIGAFVFFTIASLVLGLVAVVSLLGFSDVAGAQFYLTWGSVTAAAVWLGVLALPRSRPRGRHQAVRWVGRPGRRLVSDQERAAMIQHLEQLLALPAAQPLHDVRLRPAVPPAELDRDSA
jgi:hypothetical protein